MKIVKLASEPLIGSLGGFSIVVLATFEEVGRAVGIASLLSARVPA